MKGQVSDITIRKYLIYNRCLLANFRVKQLVFHTCSDLAVASPFAVCCTWEPAQEKPGPLYCNARSARILHKKLQGFVNKSTEILRFHVIPKFIQTPSSLILFLNHLIASGSPTVIRRSPGCFSNRKCRKKCKFSCKYHVLQQIASPYPDTYISYTLDLQYPENPGCWLITTRMI